MNRSRRCATSAMAKFVDKSIRSAAAYGLGEIQYSVQNDVLLDVTCQGIQGLVDQRGVGYAATQVVFQELKIGGTKHVAAEAAVEIGPLDPVVRRACAFRRSPNK